MGRRRSDADTERMLSQSLRFLLLRFLPRRVLPILTAIEIYRLVQRLRRGGPEPVAPRRIVTVDRNDHTVSDPDRQRLP
jgi:hypothetical protein